MPRAASNIVSPLIAIRPRSGRRMPAIALTTEVLPAPDRPKSAVTPSPASNDAERRKSPRLRPMSSESIFAVDAARSAAHQDLGKVERGEREQYRQHAQAHRRGVTGRRLRIGVDRERQRPRFARDVRHEGDRCAELAKASREREQRAGDDAGKREWQRHGEKHSHPARAERARGGLELSVYRLERKPDRAHHQREPHDGGGERGAGPSEREDDAEPLLEDLAERPAPPEEKQQEESYDDGRQYQRQVDHRIEEDLTRKARACQDVGHRHSERQADENAPE